MSFHARLLQQTADARAAMLTAPIIHSALSGDLTLASYLAFLGEAYHHVKHTVPLLGACRAALPERNQWMSVALAEYIVRPMKSCAWGWVVDRGAAMLFAPSASGHGHNSAPPLRQPP